MSKKSSIVIAIAALLISANYVSAAKSVAVDRKAVEGRAADSTVAADFTSAAGVVEIDQDGETLPGGGPVEPPCKSRAARLSVFGQGFVGICLVSPQNGLPTCWVERVPPFEAPKVCR